MKWIITYWDLFMWELDEKYVNDLIEAYDIDCSQLDITYAFENPNFNSAYFTNCVIHEIMREIILQTVEDQDDIFKLEESIYTNCFDSHYNIDPDELHTQEAKDLVINFW